MSNSNLAEENRAINIRLENDVYRAWNSLQVAINAARERGFDVTVQKDNPPLVSATQKALNFERQVIELKEEVLNDE